MELYKNYENVCYKAVESEYIFNNFKNNKYYIEMLEHVSYDHGVKFYDLIKEYDLSESIWGLFSSNDKYGNPRKYEYDNLLISPTTLRYIYWGLKINENIDLTNKSIVEIGGGYGGQMKILKDLQIYFNRYFKDYTIIDIPGASRLQQKYLSKLEITENVNFTNYFDLVESNFDVCISNYGFSEFDRDIQDVYVNKVLKNCKEYYMVYNSEDIHPFLNDAIIENENPQTGTINKILIKKI